MLRRVCFFVVISKKQKEAMKLVGEQKDKVEKAENQEEAKEIIKEAGAYQDMFRRLIYRIRN